MTACAVVAVSSSCNFTPEWHGVHRSISNDSSFAKTSQRAAPGGGPPRRTNGHPGVLQYNRQGAENALWRHEGNQRKMGETSCITYLHGWVVKRWSKFNE